MTASTLDTLEREVREVAWYHTMRLPQGIVTPGNFNTLEELERVPLPSSLDGRRCLDVGTADGFWAFEMERRGAAEVVAAIEFQLKRIRAAQISSRKKRTRKKSLPGLLMLIPCRR